MGAIIHSVRDFGEGGKEKFQRSQELRREKILTLPFLQFKFWFGHQFHGRQWGNITIYFCLYYESHSCIVFITTKGDQP